MPMPNQFVADGFFRLLSALRPVVKAAVQAEYAAQLESANDVERSRLELEMQQEIERRIDQSAPPGALY